MRDKLPELIELGNQIRGIRKAKGISQEQLAFSANLDRSYIGGVERGERNISYLTLMKICSCLGCSIRLFMK